MTTPTRDPDLASLAARLPPGGARLRRACPEETEEPLL